jgi:hypothetical protein
MGIKTLIKLAKLPEHQSYKIEDIPKGAILDSKSTFDDYLKAMLIYGQVFYEVKLEDGKATIVDKEQ